MMLAIASAPTLLLGDTDVWTEQAPFEPGLPTNEYLTSAPLIAPLVCQPQYEVRNPLLVTSGDVSTKYKPFVSLGSRPLVIALATIELMAPSLRFFEPWEYASVVCVASVTRFGTFRFAPS